MLYKYVYLWNALVNNHDFNWKQNVCFLKKYFMVKYLKKSSLDIK